MSLRQAVCTRQKWLKFLHARGECARGGGCGGGGGVRQALCTRQKWLEFLHAGVSVRVVVVAVGGAVYARR